MLKLSSDVSDVFPKVLKLSSEVSECKTLPGADGGNYGPAQDGPAHERDAREQHALRRQHHPRELQLHPAELQGRGDGVVEGWRV